MVVEFETERQVRMRTTTVSLISWSPQRDPRRDGGERVKLVVRHNCSGREFAFTREDSHSDGTLLISDYPILPGMRGVRAGFNQHGQAIWLQFSPDQGWHTARYMFPDEQEAYAAARSMPLPLRATA